METTDTRLINRSGRQWVWPAYDTELMRVFDFVQDVGKIMRHVPIERARAGVCIQAGGACGVWPLAFAHYFDMVLTYEPEPLNFECLLCNTAHESKVVAKQAALGSVAGFGYLNLAATDKNNCGCHYIGTAQDATQRTVQMVTIDADAAAFDDIVLIQLDVEGHELQALRGAAATIARCRPVIVIEEKKLPHMTGSYVAARQWLEQTFGYKQVAECHRDVVLKC
jgi:FkbM family methyltransferase